MASAVLFTCALWSFASAQGFDYNGGIHVSYTNAIDDGLFPAEEEVPLTDCQKERTKWDKLFTMLENSQMKENMLLQSIDEIIRVELQSVRAEMLQFVSSYATTCASTIERSMSQMAVHVEKTMSTHNEQSKWSDLTHKSKLGKMLEEVLLASANMSSRLENLEADCQSKCAGDQQEELLKDIKNQMSHNYNTNALLLELQHTRTELQIAHAQMARRLLPAGCEMAILFPSRSPRIYASVHPATESTLHDFTACIWVKVTDALDKTIVYSYGTKRNPYEIQFYLSHQSAVFIVGTDENKVVAENVTSPMEWSHFCNSWSSQDGTASVWVNGDLKSQSSEIAQGHVIPDKGIMQLGQEKNGCCVGGGFDELLSFSGKVTGFNVWDRVLSEEEIITQTGGEDSCNIRGNVVGWGVTQIQPHGGAQFIF
ncbi:pentraxin-related protein PTX3 [Ambystoma mexicanum]|uniref:pentraxin-related protein PTX3 n=1 Tax=Ambystoma mexicanum TaxID=8296 RepID=UPI0037E96844